MADYKLKVISPVELAGTGETGPYDLGPFARKYLAQGDSWFSLGSFPFWATTNLLEGIWLSQRSLAVNCAYPGRTLAHMVERIRTTEFTGLLGGPLAYRWDGLLLSGGGNDMIDALAVKPSAPQDLRLLLRQDEWTGAAAGARYISQPGWATFRGHMREVIDELLDARDAGINAGIPVFVHTYDRVTPRNAPAGPKMGPWLAPALRAYGIPKDDWEAVADQLIGELRAMWAQFGASHAARGLRVVDTVGTMRRADRDATGVSNDWENEIHPDRHGYGLLGEKWRPVLEA